MSRLCTSGRGAATGELSNILYFLMSTLYFLMSISVLRYLSSVAVSAGQLARHHQAQQLKCTHIQLWFANILKTALYLKSLQTSVQMSGLCLFSLVYKHLWKCSLCKTSRRFVDSTISQCLPLLSPPLCAVKFYLDQMHYISKSFLRDPPAFAIMWWINIKIFCRI